MTVRFAAIGFAHNHIYGQVKVMLDAGAQLVSYYDADPERIAKFRATFQQGDLAESVDEILEDETIQLIVSSEIPDQRAPLGIRVMQHGKDYMSDKPAFTSMEQLDATRKIQEETGRIYSIYFSERLNNLAGIKAGELVHAGAIGKVVHVEGTGPHRLFGGNKRPDWTFDRAISGGILNDFCSHQMDQFLFYSQSIHAEVVSATVGNFKHPQYPKMHDVGDVTVRSSHAIGHMRVDWLTPDGLDTWGDVRNFIVGTDGYIEARKNIDVAGRGVGHHVILVDNDGTRYFDCADVEIQYGKRLISDILNRTETAMPQAHCFLAAELALQAEMMAVDLTNLHAGEK